VLRGPFFRGHSVYSVVYIAAMPICLYCVKMAQGIDLVLVHQLT